jgi:hypothetical protein
MGHDFDPATDFCRRCGQSMQHITDDLAPCAEGSNVAGVTHILARRRLSAITAPRTR